MNLVWKTEMKERWMLSVTRVGFIGLIAAGLPATLLLAGSVDAMEFATEPMEYSCVSEPYKDATLSLPVSGRIDSILVKEGDIVQSGTALLKLERQLEKLEVQRRELIWQDKSELESSTAQAATFKVLLDSTRSLFEATKSVSQDELYKMELQYTAAQAEHERLLIAEKREEVEYQLATTNFDRRTLYAPFDGTVVEVSLQEGESSETNQPLIQLVDTSQGYLVCNVEERVGRSVPQGQRIPIRIETGDGSWESTGTVVFASPLVDSASGLMRLKISFDNPDGEVRPGCPGYIRLAAGS